jgi:acyl-CoA synthetase (AMP-forming)/AMP-acid ligase II
MQLRRAISTSALLSKHTAEHFFERFGVRLTQVYGIIEVGLPLWNDRESLEPTALGLCKPPYAAMVVDDVGTRVPTGTTGELVIQGPGLFSGYLHESSAGPANGPLRDGWFHTGDLVTQDDEGAIHYCGRKKSVINCGGNKVFPEEVEEVLRRLPEIRAVRVSAEPHPVLGNLVIAEVVVDPSQEVSVETWRSVCYSQLSRYKVPKEFRIIDSLASTGSGKLVRYSGEDTAGTHG